MEQARDESEILANRSAGRRLAVIASSYERFVGRPLVQDGDLWTAPRAIVAQPQ